ncbi:MAG TPA: S41 family peptidase [Steroidobacteraceae bacterium]|nr:S41 family peptidase [Steroidobacteraceae bacterium]
MTRFPSRAPPRPLRALALACLLTVLAACGGGGDGGGRREPSSGACSETARKQWVLDVARDWYLYPETLPGTVDLSGYATAEELLDALTATARAQGKDRYFSYLTTRSAENSLLGAGEFVGFGFRNRTDDPQRVFILDVYAASPAADAGLQRGDEVIAVDGTAVADALSSGQTFSDLMGPAEAGVRRTLTIRRGAATFDVTLEKRTVTIDPVPDGFGATVLPLAGTSGVGYLHLRSYVSTADSQLRTAFANFLAAGLEHFIIDLRYNGGGYLSTAQLLNDLLGGNRSSADVQYSVVHNAARSQQNSTVRFAPRDESVSPVQIAFLTTDATASASEINANTMWPYVTTAIVGSDTLGKPVGQVAFDLSGCEDRLRLVAFETVNSLGEGDYYDGLASVMPYACAAPDTLDAPLGSVDDAMIRAALNWMATGACEAMTATTGGRLKPFGDGQWIRPRPQQPSPAEHWLPGIQ